jgi:methyl-accepting chemotaxis protein
MDDKGIGMTNQLNRKPLGNFFIKKSLQIRLILKIVLSVIIATFICSGTLLLVYYLTYKSVLLYQMDRMTNLSKENIIFIILPSLLISGLVNFLLAVGIGLYASRKYAVPVYKLENWAKLLTDGKITAKIQFREKGELKELTDFCNTLSDDLLKKLLELKKLTEKLDVAPKDATTLAGIKNILNSFELEANTIEIHTTCYTISPSKPEEKQ